MGNAATVTAELLRAVEDRLGSEPKSAVPVLQLAALVDLLAKGVGLSDTAEFIPPDPLERLPELTSIDTVFNHCFPELPTAQEPAEVLRNKISQALLELVDDPGNRAFVVKGITPHGFLALAQVYWNIEANDNRALPIRSIRTERDGRTVVVDIPVTPDRGDYATMTWAERINQGVRWDDRGTSKGAMRKAGAKLAVLVAERLLDMAQPLPNAIGQPALEFPESGKPKARIVWGSPVSEHKHTVQAELETRRFSAPPIDLRMQRVVVGSYPEPDARYQLRGFDALIRQHWIADRDCRVWLRGAPGQGKTHSARQVFAESLGFDGKDSDRLLIWVDDADPETVTEAFAEAAKRLGLLLEFKGEESSPRAQARALLDQLRTSEWHWLVVLDNADADALIHQKLIPTGQNQNGRVLITTLSPTARLEGNGAVFEAGPFARGEAEEYLANRLPRTTPEARSQLADTVGRHPLGLSIAAATITESYLEVADWILEFNDAEHLDTVADGMDGGGYPHSLTATWKVALDQASKGFPVGLMERVALVLALQDSAGAPTWLWDRDNIAKWVYGEPRRPATRMPKELQQLQRFGVVELRGETWKRGRLAMHQLAARAIRELAGEELVTSLARELAFTWLMQMTTDTRTSRAELRRGVAPLDGMSKHDEEVQLIVDTALERGVRSPRWIEFHRQVLTEAIPLLEDCGASGMYVLAWEASSLCEVQAQPEITPEAVETFEYTVGLYERIMSTPDLGDALSVRVLTDKADLEEAFDRIEEAQATRAAMIPMHVRLLESSGSGHSSGSLEYLFWQAEQDASAAMRALLTNTADELVDDTNTRVSELGTRTELRDIADAAEAVAPIADAAESLRRVGRYSEARRFAREAKRLIDGTDGGEAPSRWRADPITTVALSYIDEGRWKEAQAVGAHLGTIRSASLLLQLGSVQEAMRQLQDARISSESDTHADELDSIEVVPSDLFRGVGVEELLGMASFLARGYERRSDDILILQKEIEFRSRSQNIELEDNERRLAVLHLLLANYLLGAEVENEALDYARQSVRSFHVQHQLNPENTTLQELLLESYFMLGKALRQCRQREEAIEVSRIRLGLLREFASAAGSSRRFEEEQLDLNLNVSSYLALEDADGFERALSEASEVFWASVEASEAPEVPKLLQKQGQQLIYYVVSSGPLASSAASEELRKVLNRFLLEAPSLRLGQEDSDWSAPEFIAKAYMVLEQPEELQSAAIAWVDYARGKSVQNGNDSDLSALSDALLLLSASHTRAENRPAAEHALRESISLREDVYSRDQGSSAGLLYSSLKALTDLLWEQDREDEAVAFETRRQELLRDHPELEEN